MIEAFRHIQKTEKIVRLEVQRRSIRDAMRLHDGMLQELDEQLAYVADFKREWLVHMKSLEFERQELIGRSEHERRAMENEWATGMEQIAAASGTVDRRRRR